MATGPARAARACALTDVRRRARSWILLAILFGALCGAATAAIVGAGRTGSAFQRLSDKTLAADVFAVTECAGDACIDTADRLSQLPSVAAAAPVVGYLGAMTTSAGRPLSVGDEACYTGAGEVDLVMPMDERFGSTINRYDVVAGSVPDPASTDQVMIAAGIARRFDLGVGDVLTLRGNACEENEAPTRARTLRIVGIERSTFEQQPEIGFYLLGVHATTALLREMRAEGVEFSAMLTIRLRSGATESQLIEQAAEAGLSLTPVLSLEEMTRGIAKSTRPDAVALLILAAFAIVAALAVVGPAMIQQAAGIGPELRTLRTLGFTRSDVIRLGLTCGLAVGALASAIAVGTAIALSPLMPVGEARLFDPEPGTHIGAYLARGWLAALVGFAVLVAIGTVIGARKEVTAWFRSVSPAASMVRALKLPPTIATGVRMALEGRGNTTSFLALFGVLVGSIGLIAASTFSSSLAHFDRSPRLVGWNWDIGAFLSGEEREAGSPSPSIAEQRAELLAIPGVSRASLATFFPPQVSLFGEIESYPVGFSTGVDSVLPTVIAGRAPTGSSEVMLNRRLARALDAKIGDVVDLFRVDPRNPDAPPKVTSPFEVVGLGVVPIGDGRVDLGFALTLDGLASLVPGTEPHMAILELAPGADVRDVGEALEALPTIDEGGVIDRVESASKLVQLDTDQVAATPRVAALLFAITSAAVLARGVIASGRRRRRELAILRSLGMTGRQATSASVWQGITAAMASIVFSIPIGVAVGAGLWSVYAESLGVKVESSTSVTQIAVIMGSGLAGAAIVAFWPAWRAARRATASTLRAE